MVLTATMGGDDSVASYAIACAPVSLVPALAAVGSVYSGSLIASGVVARPIFSTFFRGVLVLTALIFTSSILALSIAAVVGEGVRTLFLARVWRSVSRVPSGELERMGFSPAGLISQGLSMSLSMTSPFIARILLAAGPVGAVSSGEIAFRIFGTATQAGNSLIVLPRMAALSRLSLDGRHSVEVNRFIRAELRSQFAISTALAIIWILAVSALWMGVSMRDAPAVALGASWSLILIATIPLALGNMWAARVLLVLDRARLLLVASVVGVALMLVLSTAQQLLDTNSGPIWALAISQSVVATLVILLVLKTISPDRSAK